MKIEDRKTAADTERPPLTWHVCLRCGHGWYPLKPGRPWKCPACQSPAWDEPPERPSDQGEPGK